VPPVCFGSPCLVTSPWNSQWFLAEFLLSRCSCGLHWFLGIVYLCFVWIWNWVSIFFISLLILY
jgi:hypothetical protein